jgi:Na+/H+ antiporter NhaD/arsenite permease-like protein
VLIIAPIALQLTRKAGVSPVPVVIGLAVSSNLQGMAILIGDTPSMLLAAQEKLSFLDFFFYQGKPSIFWIVQLGAIAGFAVLYLFFRKNVQRPGTLPVTPVKSWVPFWLIVTIIVLLSFMNRIDPGFSWFGGTVCMLTGLGGYLWYKIKPSREEEKMLWKLDWGTVGFLMAVFVLVHMLTINGVVDVVVGRLDRLKGMSPFLIYSVIVWGSVIISAFIDNIPYIAAMLPLVSGLSVSLGLDPALLAFGVLIGSCMGGNITPIGAAANLVAIGILEKEGNPISFGSFVRIGLPFTLAATTVSWIALWFLYN